MGFVRIDSHRTKIKTKYAKANGINWRSLTTKEFII